MWQIVITGRILILAGLYLAGTFLKKWRAFRQGRAVCCACENSPSGLQDHRNAADSGSSRPKNPADQDLEHRSRD